MCPGRTAHEGKLSWHGRGKHLLQGLEVNNNVLVACQACPHKLSSLKIIHACTSHKRSFCAHDGDWAYGTSNIQLYFLRTYARCQAHQQPVIIYTLE